MLLLEVQGRGQILLHLHRNLILVVALSLPDALVIVLLLLKMHNLLKLVHLHILRITLVIIDHDTMRLLNVSTLIHHIVYLSTIILLFSLRLSIFEFLLFALLNTFVNINLQISTSFVR